MPAQKTMHLNRRAFLQRAAQLGILGSAAPLAMNLAAAGDAAAFTNTDYRAIVCIFLYGGNDYGNTVIPYDLTNYDRYAAIRGGAAGRQRGGIAYGRDELTATALTSTNPGALTDNIQYALNPNLAGLKGLWDAGKMAVQLNVGPLIVPVTLAQYQGSNRTLYPLPPKLFSHNDQQSVWQALGSEGATRGWGGRMGDLALSSNGQSTLTCISAAGNAVFVSGANALQYQISPSGAIRIEPIRSPAYAGSGVATAIQDLITETRTHAFENELAIVARRSLQMEGIVNGALGGVTLNTSFDTTPGNNPLANQMRVIARLIGARQTLGAKRQVFFASLGGFDHHNELMAKHPALLAQVDEAMSAFYNATVELGVADQVTTFTASDFGRTLASNADGSDHGWGGHHFVVGGAVQGRRFYGTAPHVALNTDDQVGQGRLLPSTSVDQFAATLARWFGVADSELPSVLPNIGNFSNTNVGFI